MTNNNNIKHIKQAAKSKQPINKAFDAAIIKDKQSCTGQTDKKTFDTLHVRAYFRDRAANLSNWEGLWLTVSMTYLCVKL